MCQVYATGSKGVVYAKLRVAQEVVGVVGSQAARPADVSGPCPAVIGRLSQSNTIPKHLLSHKRGNCTHSHIQDDASHTAVTPLALSNPQLPHHTANPLKSRCRCSALKTNLVSGHTTTFCLLYLRHTNNNLQTITSPPSPLRPSATKRCPRRTKNARFSALPPPLRHTHPQC